MKWDIEKVEEFPEEEQIKYCKKALNHYKIQKVGTYVYAATGAFVTVTGMIAGLATIVIGAAACAMGQPHIGIVLAAIGFSAVNSGIEMPMLKHAARFEEEEQQAIDEINVKLAKLQKVR